MSSTIAHAARARNDDEASAGLPVISEQQLRLRILDGESISKKVLVASITAAYLAEFASGTVLAPDDVRAFKHDLLVRIRMWIEFVNNAQGRRLSPPHMLGATEIALIMLRRHGAVVTRISGHGDPIGDAIRGGSCATQTALSGQGRTGSDRDVIAVKADRELFLRVTFGALYDRGLPHNAETRVDEYSDAVPATNGSERYVTSMRFARVLIRRYNYQIDIAGMNRTLHLLQAIAPRVPLTALLPDADDALSPPSSAN